VESGSVDSTVETIKAKHELVYAVPLHPDSPPSSSSSSPSFSSSSFPSYTRIFFYIFLREDREWLLPLKSPPSPIHRLIEWFVRINPIANLLIYSVTNWFWNTICWIEASLEGKKRRTLFLSLFIHEKINHLYLILISISVVHRHSAQASPAATTAAVLWGIDSCSFWRHSGVSALGEMRGFLYCVVEKLSQLDIRKGDDIVRKIKLMRFFILAYFGVNLLLTQCSRHPKKTTI